jgi:hypothetical protein
VIPPASRTEPAPVPAPPPPAGVKIRHLCGHDVGVVFHEKSLCPGCRVKSERESRWVRKPERQRDRLPAGSMKLIVWNGTVWKGRLTVPGAGTVFEAEGRSEVGCVHKLHKLWVAAERPGELPAPAGCSLNP